jgi:hypothetical protein
LQGAIGGAGGLQRQLALGVMGHRGLESTDRVILALASNRDGTWGA